MVFKFCFKKCKRLLFLGTMQQTPRKGEEETKNKCDLVVFTLKKKKKKRENKAMRDTSKQMPL